MIDLVAAAYRPLVIHVATCPRCLDQLPCDPAALLRRRWKAAKRWTRLNV